MAGFVFEETNSWDNMPDDYESTDYICTGCESLIEDIYDPDKPEPENNYWPCDHPADLLAYGVPARGPGETDGPTYRRVVRNA